MDWERALYILLIILALGTRLWTLGTRVQSHDESLHAKYSWNLYTGRGFQHTPLMHGPFLFHGTALSYFLFGDNDFTARLAVALIGVVIVAFPYLLRRWLGRMGALLASFFLLISPSIAYYSRYIRHDIPVMLWALTVIFAILSYLRDGGDRWLYLLAFGISLTFATKEVAFIYNAIFGLFLVVLFTRRALDHRWPSEHLKSWFGASLVLTALGVLVLLTGLLARGRAPEGLQPVASWAIAGGILGAIAALAAAALLLAATWRNLQNYRTFDLIIVMGTLCLPFLSPIPIKLAGLDPVDYTPPTIYYSGIITSVILVTSAAIGLAWNWRRWSIAAAIHYAIFLVLFTTFFTNGTGIASGLVGSMGYWLAQQGVKRGAQPWYYYGIMVPLYEYLPLLLTAITSGYLLIRRSMPSLSTSADRELAPESTEPRFSVFLLWWTALSWIIYSYAGEKMPWLVVHLALPMILLSSWALGRFIEATDWRQVLQRRAWLIAPAAPPFLVALGTLIDGILSGPFQGFTLAELSVTGQFIGGVVGTLALGALLAHLIQRSGWRLAARVLLLAALLVPVLLTVRTGWRFCYITYDYPIEHLVYAHAGPAVKDTMRQIEELSRRIAGGPKLIKVAYGADGSWPFHWYLRDYPNAVFYGENPSREQMDAPVVIAGRDQWKAVAPYMGEEYTENTYTFLWWPVEDYKNLTWKRIWHAVSDPQMRAALWDIWYNRDYRRYDELAEDRSYAVDEWPLRSQYRLYIRRDVVARIWDRGTTSPVEIGPTDPYAEGWRDLAARQVFGSQGSEEGQFQSPRGIDIGPDGFVYVADAGNHRVQKFTAQGEFVAAWGQQVVSEGAAGEPPGFNEPWSLAVAPDGDIFVADTWNHRIVRMTPKGEWIHAWGTFGQYGTDDTAGQGVFYGPRDLTIEPDQRIYVADTGNKRIQVFDPDGQFALQWGGGGAAEGYLDEPVGLAFGPEGKELYVADTWNRRVQVFDRNGTFLRQWPIDGWDAGIPEEKPYLAVDADGHVYVTDPGNYRVLVFDSHGGYLLSFGQYGHDKRSFALPTGIDVAQDGSVYVTDAHGHRVLVFGPIVFGSGSD